MRISHQQAPSVQEFFEHSSNRCIDDAKERRSWKALQKRARQYSHARESDLGVQSTLFLFVVTKLVLNKMPVQIETSTLDVNQKEEGSPPTTGLCSG